VFLLLRKQLQRLKNNLKEPKGSFFMALENEIYQGFFKTPNKKIIPKIIRGDFG
jgi:hypothetical protein|tara:strand:+ start:207 stop:368 length:162 start_codon:yes stop_codon:yes gene_type:complete